MAKITFNVPDNQLNTVMDALAYFYGYQSEVKKDLTDGSGGITTIPNPETKKAFVRRMIAEEIKYKVRQAKSEIAAIQASNEAAKNVDDNIQITG